MNPDTLQDLRGLSPRALLRAGVFTGAFRGIERHADRAEHLGGQDWTLAECRRAPDGRLISIWQLDGGDRYELRDDPLGVEIYRL